MAQQVTVQRVCCAVVNDGNTPAQPPATNPAPPLRSAPPSALLAQHHFSEVGVALGRPTRRTTAPATLLECRCAGYKRGGRLAGPSAALPATATATAAQIQVCTLVCAGRAAPCTGVDARGVSALHGLTVTCCTALGRSKHERMHTDPRAQQHAQRYAGAMGTLGQPLTPAAPPAKAQAAPAPAPASPAAAKAPAKACRGSQHGTVRSAACASLHSHWQPGLQCMHCPRMAPQMPKATAPAGQPWHHPTYLCRRRHHARRRDCRRARPPRAAPNALQTNICRAAPSH